MPLLKGEAPSGFQTLLGYRLTHWAENEAWVEIALDQRHMNRADVVHGGVLATLIDTACGFSATWCPIEGRVRRVVTLSLATSFIGQARHGILRAVAQKRGGGAKIVFCHAEVFDAENRLIATGEGTFRYRSGSEALDGIPT